MCKTGIGPQGHPFIEASASDETIEQLRQLGMHINKSASYVSRITLLPLCQVCWVARTDHVVSEDATEVRICWPCWRYVRAALENTDEDIPLHDVADRLAKHANK